MFSREAELSVESEVGQHIQEAEILNTMTDRREDVPETGKSLPSSYRK
jgi:hypothetical protein